MGKCQSDRNEKLDFGEFSWIKKISDFELG